MRTGRLDTRLAALLLALAGAALIFAACTEDPAAPVYENPFDPANPDYDGNPLDLRANYDADDGNVTLVWNHLGYGITNYDVQHGTSAFGPFALDTTLAAPTGNFANYEFDTPVRNAINYFLVIGKDESGAVMVASELVPASMPVPALLQIVGGAEFVVSRFTRLTMLTDSGDSVYVDDTQTFTGPNLVGRAAMPGVVDTLDWDFGSPRAQGDTLRLWIKVVSGGFASSIGTFEPRVSFLPAFAVVGSPTHVASNVLDLTIGIEGVERMRFALSEDDLASQTWEDPAPLRPGFVISDDLQRQTIYGEFEGDFGFEIIRSVDVQPDDLTSASFSITGLDADRVTSQSVVTLACSAVATQMRFAATPDFAGVAWEPYATSYDIDVGQETGERVVYGQFRNHWAESAVLSEWFIRVGQPLEITVLAPADSAVVRGGTVLQTRGIARSAVGGPDLDRVEIFVDGGAGWATAAGVADWTWDWDVPSFTEDTWLNLRARVITAATDPDVPDTATVVVPILVTQLVVTISTPVDGADDISAGSPVTIGGLALAAFDGAPLDRVEVVAGGESLTVVGLDIWTAAWTAPSVTEPTPYDITATAFAGTESSSTTITVTVNPTTP